MRPTVWRRSSRQVALHASRLQCLEQSRQVTTNMTRSRERTTVGIDFGTSNCVAYLPNGRSDAIPVPLEGNELLMPSVMFITRSDIAVREIQQTEFTNRLRMAKRAEAELDPGMRSTNEALRRNVEEAMKLELAQEAERQYWDQTFFSMLKSGQAALFGTPALKAYIREPLSGALVRSPKSFIGAKLDSEKIDSFVGAIGAMLAHIKGRCEEVSGRPASRAVIGRPVNYSGNDAATANVRAISAMERAAKTAGFENVEFYFEPVAAALAFEQTLRQEARVLVIDIGGGTTDCSVIRVGPELVGKFDRSSDVLSSAGSRIGGSDFDFALAWSRFMPLLGKGSLGRNGLPLPSRIFHDAVSILNVPAQIRFNNRSARYEIESLASQAANPALVRRLLKLHDGQLQYRLVNSSEMTKVKLSSQERCTTPLKYIEESLEVETCINDLAGATSNCLSQIDTVVSEAMKLAATSLDAVFITGGMGYSPIVRDYLAKKLGGAVPIHYGDMLGSVGKGLGLQAAKLAYQ